MQAHTGFTTPLLKAAKAFVMLLPVVTIATSTAFASPVTPTAQSHATCEANGLCFVQNSVEGSLSAVGFAFPREQARDKAEMLVSTRVELPYGFAGWSVDKHSSLTALFSIFEVASVEQEAELQDPAFLATLTPESFVVQASDLLPNATFAPAAQAVRVTVAPDVFFVNTSFYNLVTRFEFTAKHGHSLPSIFADEISTLGFINSVNIPQYINNATPPAAMFPLADAEHTPFVFNAAHARFDNYTDMLKVAGLV